MSTEKREKIINKVIEVIESGRVDWTYCKIGKKVSEDFPLFNEVIKAYNNFESNDEDLFM